MIYRAPDGALVLPVKIERESVWLTQNPIAELFGVKKAAISKHISNIVTSGELEREATASIVEIVIGLPSFVCCLGWLPNFFLRLFRPDRSPVGFYGCGIMRGLFRHSLQDRLMSTMATNLPKYPYTVIPI